MVSSGLVRDMKFGYDEDKWVPEKQCRSYISSVHKKRRQEEAHCSLRVLCL
jgi:hypothetical protein